MQRSAVSGQADAERGACVPGSFGPGAQANGAAVLADNALGDPKAEPCALAGLSGEEGFEDAIADGIWNSGAVVGDGDTGSGGLVDAGDADVDLAAGGRHGVDGIYDQVCEDLPELAGPSDDAGVGLITGEDVDGTLLQCGLLQLQDTVQQVGEIDHAGARGIAVEREGLLRDLADAQDFGDEELGVSAGFAIERLVFAEQIAEVEDRFEWIVDLVSDRGSHAADGGHALGFDEGGLGLFASGDVTRDLG